MNQSNWHLFLFCVWVSGNETMGRVDEAVTKLRNGDVHVMEWLRAEVDAVHEASPLVNRAAALSNTMGLGNIAGVALAIVAGGPGAVFWMWISAIVGIATKFFTCSLGVMYRGVDSAGNLQGGPMYVIREARRRLLGGMRSSAEQFLMLFHVSFYFPKFVLLFFHFHSFFNHSNWKNFRKSCYLERGGFYR